MSRPRRSSKKAVGPGAQLSPGDESRIESLTVAMSLAPGVYARNRMFDLFATAGVQRAKARAATLRGVVKHLGRACALTLEREGLVRDKAGEPDWVLKYQIPAMHLSRVVELSRVELATLRILASRAGVACLPADDEDRALVEKSLARLLVAGADPTHLGNLARVARDAATPPSCPPPAE